MPVWKRMHIVEYMLEKNAFCWMLVVGCLFERECILLNACMGKESMFLNAWLKIMHLVECLDMSASCWMLVAECLFRRECILMDVCVEKASMLLKYVIHIFEMHVMECMRRAQISECIFQNAHSRMPIAENNAHFRMYIIEWHITGSAGSAYCLMFDAYYWMHMKDECIGWRSNWKIMHTV